MNPRVIQTPKVSAVASDGIQLIVISRVTVRTNIDRLVGGAGEETILARVGEGIVTTIGSASDHKKVLENPDTISRTVLEKGLDVGTAFEILSIDIADVDVGQNIGAKLQAEQAEADKQIAQARAESRRAMAVAEEQEMSARVQDMRAKVVEAEAEVPRAMAEALRSGNLGVMDYINLKNVEADTQMRTNIADPGTGQGEGLGMSLKPTQETSPLDKIKALPELQRRLVVATILGPPRGKVSGQRPPGRAAMMLDWSLLPTATQWMDGAMESIMEIVAVVLYFLISYGIERRKKKNQPPKTPEEVLREAGMELPEPVEIEVEEPQGPVWKRLPRTGRGCS